MYISVYLFLFIYVSGLKNRKKVSKIATRLCSVCVCGGGGLKRMLLHQNRLSSLTSYFSVGMRDDDRNLSVVIGP